MRVRVSWLARRLVIPPDTEVVDSPPAAAEPTPELGDLSPPAQEPAPEQQLDEAAPPAESGAPEDPDPRAGLIEALRPLIEGDQELARELGIGQERPEDEPDVDLRAFDLDQRERATELSTQVAQAMAELTRTANPILAEYQRDLERAVEDVTSGRAERFDPRSTKLSEFAQKVRDDSTQIGFAHGTLSAEQAARRAFVENANIRRGLSKDERGTISQATFQDLLDMAYAAGQRNAPADVLKNAEKKAKELTGYEDIAKRLREYTGANGKTPRQPEGATPPTSRRDRDWAEKAPIEDLIKDRAQRGA